MSKRYVGDRYFGTQGEIKPLNVADGAIFIEHYGLTASEWVKVNGQWVTIVSGVSGSIYFDSGVITFPIVSTLSGAANGYVDINLNIVFATEPIINATLIGEGPNVILRIKNITNTSFRLFAQSSFNDTLMIPENITVNWVAQL